MWDRETWILYQLIVIQQNIQVDGTRPVLYGFHPAEVILDKL